MKWNETIEVKRSYNKNFGLQNEEKTKRNGFCFTSFRLEAKKCKKWKWDTLGGAWRGIMKTRQGRARRTTSRRRGSRQISGGHQSLRQRTKTLSVRELIWEVKNSGEWGKNPCRGVTAKENKSGSERNGEIEEGGNVEREMLWWMGWCTVGWIKFFWLSCLRRHVLGWVKKRVRRNINFFLKCAVV